MDLATRRRRQALFLFFLLPGIAMSSWVTRTPDIRDGLEASTGQMGWILFGLSLGSMIGILCSGRLVSRYGTRPVIGVGTAMIVVSLAVISAGSLLSSAPLVMAGLCMFGAGMGAGEVAINVDGADVERITGKTTLPTLHGCFSLGTVVGACAGIAATVARLPVHWHLAAVTVIAAAIFWYAIRSIPADTGLGAPGQPDSGAAGRPRPALWKDTKLVLIGAIVLAMALAEGAANDWLPLLMVDGHGLDAASGSLVYTGFAAAMTIGRFGGTYFLDRFGRIAVMRASAASGALGLLLVIFSDNAVLAGAAVLFWGLDASLGFPVALSAAGETGPDQTARVSLVAIIGYLAFLVGPPGLGFLGDHHWGLRPAMLVVLVFVAAAFALAPAVDTRRRSAAAATAPPRRYEALAACETLIRELPPFRRDRQAPALSRSSSSGLAWAGHDVISRGNKIAEHTIAARDTLTRVLTLARLETLDVKVSPEAARPSSGHAASAMLAVAVAVAVAVTRGPVARCPWGLEAWGRGACSHGPKGVRHEGAWPGA
ncbi:MFS transporter [Nonomuraea polychroma]|uniref:MFS transporter n=1 Tax=Nonomuraea polychroma TaxID=46176 RepID=UPI003D8ADC09